MDREIPGEEGHDAILKLSKVLYLKDSLPLEPGQHLST